MKITCPLCGHAEVKNLGNITKSEGVIYIAEELNDATEYYGSVNLFECKKDKSHFFYLDSEYLKKYSLVENSELIKLPHIVTPGNSAYKIEYDFYIIHDDNFDESFLDSQELKKSLTGLAVIKYEELVDSWRWTLYSRTQTVNTIELADAYGSLRGEPIFWLDDEDHQALLKNK